ncbi:MAG: glycine cleavage system protein H [Acidimicrobiales bacterium]
MTTPTRAGCALPEDLLYDLDHDVWVRVEGGDAVVGMTDVAQTRCGRLVHVGWKPVGRRIARGRPVCIIESAKWVGPMLSPLSGELVTCNDRRFADDVAIANRDPYGDGWLVRLRPESEGEFDLLADGATAYEHYRRVIDEEGIHCIRCAD